MWPYRVRILGHAVRRAHLEDCPPCEEQYDFEELFLKFLRARCKTQGAPTELKKRVLRELFGE